MRHLPGISYRFYYPKYFHKKINSGKFWTIKVIKNSSLLFRTRIKNCETTYIFICHHKCTRQTRSRLCDVFASKIAIICYMHIYNLITLTTVMFRLSHRKRVRH